MGIRGLQNHPIQCREESILSGESSVSGVTLEARDRAYHRGLMGCKEALDFLDNVHTVLCLSELIAMTRLSRPLGKNLSQKCDSDSVGFSDQVVLTSDRQKNDSLGEPLAATRKSGHHEHWHNQWHMQVALLCRPKHCPTLQLSHTCAKTVEAIYNCTTESPAVNVCHTPLMHDPEY